MRVVSTRPLDQRRLRQKPKPAKKVEAKKPRGVSWWLPCAQLDQREQFAAAARHRNAEMQGDPIWQRTEKLGQTGQL